MIKVSAGTASVLGFKKIATDAPPTTAYLLAGDKCGRDCSFCPQGTSGNSGRADMLSRMVWPSFSADQVVAALDQAVAQQSIKRVCLQVMADQQALSQAAAMLEQVKQGADVPVCMSASISTVEEARQLINLGADKVSIAIDCASEEHYPQVKGGSLKKRLAFLETVNHHLPGRVGTHLIVGLGETEQEMIQLIGRLTAQGIGVALFAFTPVKGTKEAQRRQAPELAVYRRIQTAYYLLIKNLATLEGFIFAEEKIIDYGLPREVLLDLLRSGEAFQTSGCPDCNRPYYNEKPGGIIYNYPRRLQDNEVIAALELL